MENREIKCKLYKECKNYGSECYRCVYNENAKLSQYFEYIGDEEDTKRYL